ncbi:multicopper oxidase domain-containing protein [Paenibacillus frigoriresistens]|uniref:multicopper oxidase domain-containing protein n=1 Tax=Paenibacillus alginolyticus TaxID=59839 RepID=UPI0015631920|nr:multicopper oxidase domain-containing protein [Paenibacillus frigoriresistens]NRF90056.1 multicopper oxidase domain-containing protein [Paenibacillus frigoriresistens]
MYSISVLIILFVSLLFLIFTWIGSVKASRLLYNQSLERMYRKASKLLFWSWFPAIPAAVIIGAIVWIQQSMDPVFWQDRVFIQAPLVVLPILTIWFVSVPKLIKLRSLTKQSLAEPGAVIEPTIYHRAANPGLIIPFQMTALGALTALYFSLVPPVPFRWLDISIPMTAFVLATVGLWSRHQIRFKQVSKMETYVVPTLWKRALTMVGVLAVVAGSAYYLFMLAMNNSQLPAEIDMASGTHDYGGQAVTANMSPHNHGTEGMNASSTSGKTVDAWTYNGQIPGPELRMKQGELVEITLVNEDIEHGVTAHWHGLDVPNAEDGVAGATQNAVMPGESCTYRFRAEQVGTFWYHSHQDSQEAVSMGLFGALIVEPKVETLQQVKDITVMTHRWEGNNFAIGASDQFRTHDNRARDACPHETH